MKIKAKIGVATEAQLRHPTTCFQLSRTMAQVSDALAFSEFYLHPDRKTVPTTKDLQHISTSIYSSGNAAQFLAKQLLNEPELEKQAKAYATEALSFNKVIRKRIPGTKETDKSAKPMSLPEIRAKASQLRIKANTLQKKVEGLCTVDMPKTVQTPAPAPTAPGSSTVMRGRFGMSGPPRKRPIYPRYFVASMGRSRR